MSETTLFDPINLDGLSIDPGDYTAAARIFDLYSKYCRHKAKAMVLRQGGNVAAALRAEEQADTLYELLPQSARW